MSAEMGTFATHGVYHEGIQGNNPVPTDDLTGLILAG